MLLGVLPACAGGDLGHRAGEPEDLAGKLVPAADPLAGAVVDAVVVAYRQPQQVMGQVLGVGGVAALVVYHLDAARFCAQGCHGAHKVFAGAAVQPGRAHDKIPPAELPHILLAQKLGGAVGALGGGQGGLVQGDAAGLLTRKHIVGGDMHQPRADLFGRLGQVGGAEGVGLKGIVPVRFAAIHIGIGRAVQDRIRLVPAHKGDHLGPVGNVQLGQVHRQHTGVFQPLRDGPQRAAPLAQLALQLGAKLAVCPCDQ